MTEKKPEADEIWTELYGSPDGSWFLLSGEEGEMCPPLVGTLPLLGPPNDVVQTVYNERYHQAEAKRAAIQQELAGLMQVGQQSVSRYLNGTSTPDLPSAGWTNLVREYWKAKP